MLRATCPFGPPFWTIDQPPNCQASREKAKIPVIKWQIVTTKSQYSVTSQPDTIPPPFLLLCIVAVITSVLALSYIIHSFIPVSVWGEIFAFLRCWNTTCKTLMHVTFQLFYTDVWQHNNAPLISQVYRWSLSLSICLLAIRIYERSRIFDFSTWGKLQLCLKSGEYKKTLRHNEL